MDATTDTQQSLAGAGSKVGPRGAAGYPSDDRAQIVIRRISWFLAWAVPVVALVVGISLTSAGTAEVWTPMGGESYDVLVLAVWPAGLTLLGVGTLGLTAAAIATAAFTTKR